MLYIGQNEIERTGATSALVPSIPGENKNNRVLGYTGARKLTPEEVARVSGSGEVHTQAFQ